MFYRCTIIRFYGVNADDSISEHKNYRSDKAWPFLNRKAQQKYNPADKERWQKQRRKQRKKRML
jgi:hypothetical protein